MAMADAVETQLTAWQHLAGDGHAAEREILRAMAAIIDVAVPAVVDGGAAPLPALNACRYMHGVIRLLAPAESGDDNALQRDLLAAWTESD